MTDLSSVAREMLRKDLLTPKAIEVVYVDRNNAAALARGYLEAVEALDSIRIASLISEPRDYGEALDYIRQQARAAIAAAGPAPTR